MVVMCIIEKAFKKLLNSFAVNCFPLSNIIVSGIPNLAKRLSKNLIAPLHEEFLHFITSGNFENHY